MEIREQLLSWLSRDPSRGDFLEEHTEIVHDSLEANQRRLLTLFPSMAWDLCGADVLDVGCYHGMETVALSKLGARSVLGIDIRTDTEEFADLKSRHVPGKEARVVTADIHETGLPDGSFDAIVTISAYEHFRDPHQVSRECWRLLRPGGRLYLTSGVWSSPWGSHMHFFTRVPWVQFIFPERTVLKVRSRYRSDGAETYAEVEGGLNDIGVRTLRNSLEGSGFRIEHFHLNPVFGLTPLTRVPGLNEFFTNKIHAIARKQPEGS